MKNILIAILIACSFAFSQGTQLKLYDYQLSVNANAKTKSGKIGFATMKPVKNAKDENTFGVWLSNNTNVNSVFLEIKDGQKSVASVTAKDFSTKAKFQTSGARSTAVYKSGTGANTVDIIVESDVLNNESMPLGKTIAVTIKAKTAGKKMLATTATLYGDGFVRSVGTNGASSSRVENGKGTFPLLSIVGSNGTFITVDKAEQKSAGKVFTILSGNVASTGDEVVILSFMVAGTTVKSYEKAANQAANIEASISNKKEVTELAIINSVSNEQPFPGDTVTYTISYQNIGNSFAQDAVISNPIPQSMMFVENSAVGENAEVSFERKQAAPPQQSEVISVNWKIKKKILPGEEGIVSMKAIIK